MLLQMLGHVMNRHSRDGVGLPQRRPVSRRGTVKSPVDARFRLRAHSPAVGKERAS